MSKRALPCLLLSLLLSGCALLSKSKPVDIHYLTPEVTASSRDTRQAMVGATPAAPAVDLQLRIGRIIPAAYLRDRVAFRDTGAEIGFYDRIRWAEPPEAYLRRGLSRALFQREGLDEIVSGTGPSLDVDLEIFDEIRAPRPAARVQATWRLRDGRTVIAQRTVTIERPITRSRSSTHAEPSELVASMSSALTDVVSRIVTDVLAELSHRTPPTDTASATPR